MKLPKSYKMYMALTAIALVSGHIVQDTRIWGGDAVARHDDRLFIEPGTVRLASPYVRENQFEPTLGPEFELPLPPVASLEPVAPLPRLPMLFPTRLSDMGLSSFDLPSGDLDAYGVQCETTAAESSAAQGAKTVRLACSQVPIPNLETAESLSFQLIQHTGG